LTAGITLNSLKRKDLLLLHNEWVRPEKLVIVCAGSVSQSDFNKYLASLNKVLKNRKNRKEILLIPGKLSDEKKLNGPRWIDRSLGREQVHLLIGGLGLDMNSDDRHALRLVYTILGGQSGRLFIELREKKSLAYSVAPMGYEGIEKGFVGTYIACSPDKKQEAISGVSACLERLAMRGPSESEIKRAREYYLGSRAMELQSVSSVATYCGLKELYNKSIADEYKVEKKIRAVSAGKIKEVCRKYLVEPYKIISSVG